MDKSFKSLAQVSSISQMKFSFLFARFIKNKK